MTQVSVFDDTNCTLGEGPLWHPERGELFWFDIPAKRMLWHRSGATEIREFPEIVTAAGWVDHDTLLIASETGLLRYDIDAHETELLAPLEADEPGTRSNDGRADPQGGFWIGTMRKDESGPTGAIYRYYRGEVRRLYPGITVPNSICFAPDGSLAYLTDTPTRKILRQRLDAQGWPKGEPEVHIDLTGEGLYPDGSVVDAAGGLWNAQWGAAQVSHYDASGKLAERISLPADRTTCPAFIGRDLTTMICTSAAIGTPGESAAPGTTPHGQTFAVEGLGPGLPEWRVKL